MTRFTYFILILVFLGINITKNQAQCTPPSTPPSLIYAVEPKTTNIYLGWAKGSGDYSLIVAKEGSPVLSMRIL